MANWLLKLDLWKYAKVAEKKLVNGFNEAIQLLREFAIEISPEDTSTFAQNHDIIDAKVINWKIIATLENGTEYAFFLEYGVQWKEYNYYKGSKWWARINIYSWVGNRTYTRTIDEKQLEVFKIIQDNLKLW